MANAPQPAGWPFDSGPAGRHATEGETTDALPEISATPPPRQHGGWWRWRRSRPFWEGLLVILGGGWIILTEHPPLRVVVHLGMQGFTGLAIPIVMVLCGALLWFNPQQRLFYSILAVLLSLGSFITSNLGGFVIGMLLGLVGGSLAFAWALPSPDAPSVEAPQPASGETSQAMGTPDQV